MLAKGVPELGLDSYDPLIQDHVKVELPGGLKVEFTDGKVTGLRNCIVDNVR